VPGNSVARDGLEQRLLDVNPSPVAVLSQMPPEFWQPKLLERQAACRSIGLLVSATEHDSVLRVEVLRLSN